MRLQKLIYQGIVWRGIYYASVFLLNIVIARVFRAAESGVINYIINNLSGWSLHRLPRWIPCGAIILYSGFPGSADWF